ncbi:UNVERIFIED_CONTAM: methylmalonyl-CoA mutase [Euhalothece sp. KZN 001]|jgi:methylmalonyl-CoA mutase C-terminal domain/subunit
MADAVPPAHPPRCLIAKLGLDGHDRGAHVIARAFRDAGFEVVYSGLHRTPDEVVTAAVDEDVDVLGISMLSGAHESLIPPVLEGLAAVDRLDEMLVILGGIIPDDDREALLRSGVDAVFGPGTAMEETVAFVRDELGADVDA